MTRAEHDDRGLAQILNGDLESLLLFVSAPLPLSPMVLTMYNCRLLCFLQFFLLSSSKFVGDLQTLRGMRTSGLTASGSRALFAA